MLTMRVLGVDPGKTVGLARATVNHGLHMEMGGELPYTQFIKEVDNWLEGVQVIVYERFMIYPHMRAHGSFGGLETPRAIGVLEHAASIHGIATVVPQTASDASVTVSNGRLRDVGMWVVGSDHARSASRHIVLWAIRQKFLI